MPLLLSVTVSVATRETGPAAAGENTTEIAHDALTASVVALWQVVVPAAAVTKSPAIASAIAIEENWAGD